MTLSSHFRLAQIPWGDTGFMQQIAKGFSTSLSQGLRPVLLLTVVKRPKMLCGLDVKPLQYPALHKAP